MIDFASALYLGMRHASSSLRPWDQITAGKPAALEPVQGAQAVASQIAALQGCEAATLGTSTLHLVWDMFNPAGLARSAIYLDAGAYPILRWGAERAWSRGVLVRSFRHHDAQILAELMWLDRTRGLRPMVVADGLCPACGDVAPLREYLECASRYGGSLIVDDTQALGVLGRDATPGSPYGRGGGGSLPWLGLQSPHIVVIASLAKGFGVPAAVLSGNRKIVEDFEMQSETRTHCSPPSVAAVRAAESALHLNMSDGDRLRMRLLGLVSHFRRALRRIAWDADGSLFPVQTISAVSGARASQLHQRLLAKGVKTVLHRGTERQEARISFLINARHGTDEIDFAVSCFPQEYQGTSTADRVIQEDCLGPCSQQVR